MTAVETYFILKFECFNYKIGKTDLSITSMDVLSLSFLLSDINKVSRLITIIKVFCQF
jgi:hypothetical protein